MATSSNPANLSRGFQLPWNADRVGVFASVLCAIHCAATPFLLILLPTFGKIWAHPASHWLMALIVVPIALLMVSKGYRRHQRKWIIGIGVFGVLFVLVGAAAPYFETGPVVTEPVVASSTGAADESCGAEESCGSETTGESEAVAETGCVDACCPSLIEQADGTKKLHIPLASILTTIGGVFLIATHIGNLCLCACCKKGAKACA